MLEDVVFSKTYRAMVSMLKKLLRQDLAEEKKLYDIRASEGSGRKGPAGLPKRLSKSRQPRRNSGKVSGSADNEAKKDSDSGADTSTPREV